MHRAPNLRIALDIATGKIKGHFQCHPNDSWDWDEVSALILVDYRQGGRTVKGLICVARDGYLWRLERTADKINFVDGKPFVKDRAPRCRPGAQARHRQEGRFLSLAVGRQDWPPVAFQPEDPARLHTGKR